MNIALEQADSALTAAQELIEAGQLAEALTNLETAIAGFEGAGGELRVDDRSEGSFRN